jgi:hypothetical protein
MKKFNNKNKKIKKKSVKPNTKEIEKKKKVSALEDEEILKLQESYKEVLYLSLLPCCFLTFPFFLDQTRGHKIISRLPHFV